MAHQRVFRGRGISQSQRRKKTWTSLSNSDISCSGVSLVVPDVGPGPSAAVALRGVESSEAGGFVEGTILRIRGSIEVPKTVVDSNGIFTTVAFGIGFVTNEAFQAGAVPNPAIGTGADWDGWMFYRSNVQGSLDANAGIFDVKAMRKWEDGMTFCLIAGVCNDSGVTPGEQITFLVARALILLP